MAAQTTATETTALVPRTANDALTRMANDALTRISLARAVTTDDATPLDRP